MLTLFGSMPSSWLFAIETTANASLISQRSTFFASQLRLRERVLDRRRRRGGEPLGRLRVIAPRDELRERPCTPRFFASSADISTTAAAPSLSDARVAGGDRAVLLERRAQRRQLLDRRHARAPRRSSTWIVALLVRRS